MILGNKRDMTDLGLMNQYDIYGIDYLAAAMAKEVTQSI